MLSWPGRTGKRTEAGVTWLAKSGPETQPPDATSNNTGKRGGEGRLSMETGRGW
jgi:hypothetical protein